MLPFQVALVGPGTELQLMLEGEAVLHADVVEQDDALAAAHERASARDETTAELDAPAAGQVPGHTNLFAVGELIASRAATPSTRRQYAAIYRRFGDWLSAELDRPAMLEDLGVDESPPSAATSSYTADVGEGRPRRPPAASTSPCFAPSPARWGSTASPAPCPCRGTKPALRRRSPTPTT